MPISIPQPNSGPRPGAEGAAGPGVSTGSVTLPLALAAFGLIGEYEFVVLPRLAGHGPRLLDGLVTMIDLKLGGAVRSSRRGRSWCGMGRAVAVREYKHLSRSGPMGLGFGHYCGWRPRRHLVQGSSPRKEGQSPLHPVASPQVVGRDGMLDYHDPYAKTSSQRHQRVRADAAGGIVVPYGGEQAACTAPSTLFTPPVVAQHGRQHCRCVPLLQCAAASDECRRRRIGFNRWWRGGQGGRWNIALVQAHANCSRSGR